MNRRASKVCSWTAFVFTSLSTFDNLVEGFALESCHESMEALGKLVRFLVPIKCRES